MSSNSSNSQPEQAEDYRPRRNGTLLRFDALKICAMASVPVTFHPSTCFTTCTPHGPLPSKQPQPRARHAVCGSAPSLWQDPVCRLSCQGYRSAAARGASGRFAGAILPARGRTGLQVCHERAVRSCEVGMLSDLTLSSCAPLPSLSAGSSASSSTEASSRNGTSSLRLLRHWSSPRKLTVGSAK